MKWTPVKIGFVGCGVLLALIVLIVGVLTVTGVAWWTPMSPREREALVDRLNDFMKDGFSVDMVYTAHSVELVEVEGFRRSHVPAYFMAGRVNGPGVENHIGVWITLKTVGQPPGVILSVNDVAKRRSDAPDASATASRVRMSHRPAMDLRNYVESRARMGGLPPG